MVQVQPYTVFEDLPGGVELRHYPAHKLVSVDVESSFSHAGEVGFQPLVRYISGMNSSGEQIEMTAPVTHFPRGNEKHTISFVLPEGMSDAEVPGPADSRVRIVSRPDSRVATLRWRGGFDHRQASKAEGKLRQSLMLAGYPQSGSVFFARYDPPIVPLFMRRNEVLLTLD